MARPAWLPQPVVPPPPKATSCAKPNQSQYAVHWVVCSARLKQHCNCSVVATRCIPGCKPARVGQQLDRTVDRREPVALIAVRLAHVSTVLKRVFNQHPLEFSIAAKRSCARALAIISLIRWRRAPLARPSAARLHRGARPREASLRCTHDARTPVMTARLARWSLCAWIPSAPSTTTTSA